MVKIGIDTGGTFTDIVILHKNRLIVRKVLSDHHNPQKSLMAGLEGFLASDFRLTYGTTIAVNAFLEKKGEKTAFLATSGFEHILHIQRQKRINLFSLCPRKANPLIPMNLCFGVQERVRADGSIEKELDAAQLRDLSGKLKAKHVKSLAIAFLHSYINNANEARAGEFFRKEGFFVSCSSEILPEQKEYERAVLSALNAYLMPPFHRHIEEIQRLIKKPFFIMQSVGGFLSPRSAQAAPVRTMLSGPVGGVVAARHFRESDRLITLDMGGTSTDISLIDGDISITQESELENLPIRIPTVFIKTIGAGGGSIAWFDRAGVLKLGPMSAGSNPGPACYGKGLKCTLTDAYVVLGYILPRYFLGGAMQIYPQRSRSAVNAVAERLGKSLEETAEGIVELSVILMEKALRNTTLQRGYDPRIFSLMPFGGAGGLAAADLAEKIGISTIVIPPYQGVFSAVGMLIAKSVRESSKALHKKISSATGPELDRLFESLEEKTAGELGRDFIKKPDIGFTRTADIRYAGQGYYLNIPFDKNIEDLPGDFERAHRRIYGYVLEERYIEIVNIRVKAFSMDKNPVLPAEKSLKAGFAEPEYHRLYYRGCFIDALFYIKESIKQCDIISGPAVLSSSHSTAFIPPGYVCQKTRKGNLLVRKNEV